MLPEISAADFDEDVLSSPVPVIVHFWAMEEVKCHVMERVIEGAVAASETPIRAVNIEVYDAVDLVRRLQIEAVPTCVVFSEGVERFRFVGVRRRASVLAMVQGDMRRMIDLRDGSQPHVVEHPGL